MLARKSFLLIGSKIISQALSLIALLYMTRYLGEDVYGSITLAIAMVGSLNIVADLGFTSAHIKRVSEGKDIDACVSTYAAVKIALTSLMVILTLGGIVFYSVVMHQRFLDTSVDILLLMMVYYVLFDLASIAIYTFDAKIETFKSQLTMLADPLVRVPLVIFISVSRLGSTELALAYLAGAFGVGMMAIFLLRREGVHWKKPTYFRSYLTFAAPMMIVSVVGTLQQFTDRLFLGLFGTTHDVAIYYSGFTILTVFGVVGSAVGTTIFPAFSRLHALGDMEGIRKTTQEAERFISMLCMPALLFVALFSYPTARIVLGSNFEAAGASIQILAFGVFIGLINQPYTAQINGVGHTRVQVKLTLLFFLIDIIMVALLVPSSLFGIPMFGLSIMGVALAFVVATGTCSVISRVAAYRISGTIITSRLGLHALSVLVAALVIIPFSNVWHIDRWYDLLAAAIVFEMVYLGVLIATREFRRHDWNFIMSVVSPINLGKYIKDEMKGKK